MMVEEWICLACSKSLRGRHPSYPQPDPDWPCRICKSWDACYRFVDEFLLELALAARDEREEKEREDLRR